MSTTIKQAINEFLLSCKVEDDLPSKEESRYNVGFLLWLNIHPDVCQFEHIKFVY